MGTIETRIKTDEERNNIQIDTILQVESGAWLEESRKMLIASSFDADSTPCAGRVKKLLSGTGGVNVASVNYGKQYEKVVLFHVQQQENINKEQCELFIDIIHNFLGATSDGLAGNDYIVQIKYPYSTFKIAATDTIKAGKIKFWHINDADGRYTVNRHSE